MNTHARLVSAAILLLALAACNAGETLALSPAAQGSAPAAQVAVPQSAFPQGLAIAIAPVTGAPASFGQALAAELASQSASLGLPVSAGAAGPAAYVLKGYVSALAETPATYVYVWDLSDSAGNRLHRIQGRENAPAGDPWSPAGADAARRIAAHTAEQLAAWLAANAA